MTFFDHIKSLPRWYVGALLVLLICYLGGWAYTIHTAQLQRAAGHTPVMPVTDHDSNSYANLTQSLLEGHFAEPGEQYEYFHTPGYPAFVAALFFVTRSYFAVTLIQLLLVFATALMTYVLGSRLVSERAGMWASLLFLANPIVPLNAAFIVTDTLFAFLLTLGFTVIITQFVTRPLPAVLAAAFIFGAAIYVRPVGFIAFPILAAPLLALAYPWPKKTAYAALMLAIVSVLLVPWLLRNKADSGVFAFSSLVPFDMAYYNIPHFWMSHGGIPLDKGIAQVEQESGVPRGTDANGYPANWYNLASSPKLAAFYTRVLLANPISYTVWHLYNSVGFFVNAPINPPNQTLNIKQMLTHGQVVAAVRALMSPWWLFVERILMLAGILLLLCGVWQLRRQWLTWAFVFVILYLAALGGPSAQARYRLPVEPLLSIFMVSGIYLLKNRFPKNADTIA